ncbi:Protein kinase domain-containing protein [Durusdinium trenchii]|uniref:Protein kinase domain-containing protein n=1 Tax=Durusdinium trenchii TaxID=1381693 RepID=A0ABP0NF15_9DINO
MEILLKDTKGVSPETIISIRAGATRRQVPVSLVGDKPFRFPCALRDCGAIKVDLLTVAASARAVLTGSGEEQTVNLAIGSQTVPKQADQPAEDAEVTLLLRHATGQLSLSKEEETAKTTAIRNSAEEYLTQHGVHTFLQGLLSGVIKDRRERRAKVAQLFKAKAEQKAPMEQLRTQARDALLQGARSGRLLEVLRDGNTPKNKSQERTVCPPRRWNACARRLRTSW